MAYLTPKQENRRLWIMLVLSLICLVVTNSALTSCKPKAKPGATSADVPAAVDTIRPQLEQVAHQAEARADDDRKRGTQSVTDFTTAAKRYDSLRAELDKN